MNWQEILGYVASVIVAVSLMMNSLLKLRWINLIGSAMFSAYGFIIGAIPVGVLNGFIALINIYYLVKMYNTEDYFKILSIESLDNYLSEYLNFYKQDIHQFFPLFKEDTKFTFGYYILRNLALSGVVLGYPENENTLIINLDFVNPEYRDLKPGKFLYKQKKQLFIEQGFEKVKCVDSSPKHEKYLLKMGFKKQNEGENSFFVLNLA